MERKFARLQCIENNDSLDWDLDYEFIFHLQHAALLVLYECGRLNMEQLKIAESGLQTQRQERAKAMQIKRG